MKKINGQGVMNKETGRKRTKIYKKNLQVVKDQNKGRNKKNINKIKGWYTDNKR